MTGSKKASITRWLAGVLVALAALSAIPACEARVEPAMSRSTGIATRSHLIAVPASGEVMDALGIVEWRLYPFAQGVTAVGFDQRQTVIRSVRITTSTTELVIESLGEGDRYGVMRVRGETIEDGLIIRPDAFVGAAAAMHDLEPFVQNGLRSYSDDTTTCGSALATAASGCGVAAVGAAFNALGCALPFVGAAPAWARATSSIGGAIWSCGVTAWNIWRGVEPGRGELLDSSGCSAAAIDAFIETAGAGARSVPIVGQAISCAGTANDIYEATQGRGVAECPSQASAAVDACSPSTPENMEMRDMCADPDGANLCADMMNMDGMEQMPEGDCFASSGDPNCGQEMPMDPENPDGTNPDEMNPDGTNPDEMNPDETNPDGTNPDGTEPDGTEPDGTEPDGTDTGDGTDGTDTGSGDTGGDTGSGDTGSGDTGSGDTGSGDTGSGDTGSGDTGGGDTGGGWDSGGGDSGGGDSGGGWDSGAGV